MEQARRVGGIHHGCLLLRNYEGRKQMEILITARELLDKGLWIKACNVLGINEWAINEGLMNSFDTITITAEQAKEIGLVNKL